jgi:hypothetical protein
LPRAASPCLLERTPVRVVLNADAALDKRTDEFFTRDVAPGLALDAFRHPYAYLGLVEANEEHEELLAA